MDRLRESFPQLSFEEVAGEYLDKYCSEEHELDAAIDLLLKYMAERGIPAE